MLKETYQMKKRFSIDDLKNSACAGINTQVIVNIVPCVTKASKFRNIRTIVDGIPFDSKGEAGRYVKLKLLLQSGEIKNLELQKPYELNDGGTHSLKYVADFVYIDCSTGETIVEDFKGHRTREYNKKKALMLKVHGIKILETKN